MPGFIYPQNSRVSSFQWILGTTTNIVQWYRFTRGEGGKVSSELLPELDLQRVTVFSAKEDARATAERAGLKTWRYIRL